MAKGSTGRAGMPRMAGGDRKALIIEKAREIFIARGLAATTKEIARAAGITEATMFSHFPSKNALFEAAVIAPLSQLMQSQAAIETDFFEAETAKVQQAVFLRGVTKNVDTMKEILPLISIALFGDPENGEQIFDHTVQHFLDDIEASIAAASSEFIGRIDRRAIAFALFGIYLGAALGLRFDKRSPSQEALAQTMTEFIWRALFAPKETFDQHIKSEGGATSP